MRGNGPDGTYKPTTATTAARAVVRVVAVVVLVLAPAVALAAPAAADFSICKDAPPPVSPKTGLPGLLTPTPADIPASAPDPFADPKVPIGDVYGYNWHWSNYDLGCGNDFLRDPQAVTNTATGNLLFSLTDGLIASLATLEQMAKTLPLDWLATTLQGVTAALRSQILTLWFPIATVALAVLVLWRAKKASYHETAKVTAVFAGAAALAVFSLVYPAQMSQQVDKVVTTVAQVTGSTFSTSATDAVNRESAYRTWLAGSFGDADSPAAKKYGPRLMSATHYTWSDWKRIQDDPAAKTTIDEAKSAEFKKVAGQLEREDPAAYETFTGRGERTGPALLGIVSAAAMSLFVGMAAIMIVVARIMMQGLTLIAPIVAVVGILPKQHAALARLWDLFTAAVVAVAKFTLAGGIMTIVLGALQAADLSGAARLFFIVIATVVAIIITKPLRSLKTLVPGLDPNQSYLKKLVQYVGPAIAGGAGSFVGVREGVQAAADEPADRYDLTDKPVTHRPSAQPASSGEWHTLSMPALPAPTTTQTSLPDASSGAIQPTPADDVQARQPLPPARTTNPALPASRLALTAAPADERIDQAPPTTPDKTPRPPSGPMPSSTPITPDAIIVRTDPALYHPGAPTEEYVPSSELQFAEDGTEHERIVYHADRSGEVDR